MKLTAKIIGYGLIVLLLAATIGLTYKFTNGFNEDFKTFYVEYGGKQILTGDSKMTLSKNVVHCFFVKYTFDKETAEPKEYKLKILPNMTRDFDFTVDGERYLFSKVGELTEVFVPIKHATYFELYIPESLGFAEVLKKAYNGADISVPADAWVNNPYPFRLQVSSYNEKVTYNIDFTFEDSVTEESPNNGEEPAPPKPEQPEVKKYEIDYDSLGWASMTVVDFNCPAKAAAGETVTFTATVKPEYATEYRISHIVVRYGSGEDYIDDLQGNNGTYIFTMPDASTIEKEESGGYMSLMFYIIPIDM